MNMNNLILIFMKLKKLFLLLVCIATAVCGFAQTSGTCGANLTWSFNNSTGILTISGTGTMTTHPWSAISTQIKQVKIEDGVTNICGLAFRSCSNLITVTIGNDVKIIEMFAFKGCISLTSVAIGNSVEKIEAEAFMDCTLLPSIIIPESVTSIEYYVFRDCSNLTSVTIGSGVTSMDGDVFMGTPWYNNQPEGVIYINKVLYKYKGTMPENTNFEVKSGTICIAGYAFAGLADGLFKGCPGLTSITIPNSVTNIGNRAFVNCVNLSSIIIGNGVTTVEFQAFAGCSGLSHVIVKKNIPPKYVITGSYDYVPPETCILHVPAESKNLYQKAEGWQDFKNIVEDADNFSAIENVQISKVTVYPNPVSENFFISGITENTFVTISDINGKIVLKQMVSPNRNISAAHLPSGIYFVNVKNKTVKIVKQ